MTRALLLLAAVLLTAAACNPFRTVVPLDGTVCVRPGSQDAVVEATLDAAERWRQASGGRVDLAVLVSDDASCDLEVAGAILGDAAGRCLYYGDPEILLDVYSYGRDPGGLAQTMVHELGHAMGADHSEVVTDVMFHVQTEGVTRQVSPGDLRQVYDAH